MTVAEIADLPAGLRALVAENAIGCWLWQGRIDTEGRGAGYGRIGRAERAHLVVFTLLEGPIPRGYELDHLCRNRACVNPAHLEPVTHAENMARLRRKRCRRGHEMRGANIDKSGSNGRTCKACRNDRRRARAAEVRAGQGAAGHAEGSTA